MVRCTLAAIKELKSRRLINCLKDDGSKETQSYVDLYEDELSSKDAALQAAESEILRLKAEVRRYAMQDRVGEGLILDVGDELDLYEGEILDTVLDAIESCSSLTGGRRQQHRKRRLVALWSGADSSRLSGIYHRQGRVELNKAEPSAMIQTRLVSPYRNAFGSAKKLQTNSDSSKNF